MKVIRDGKPRGLEVTVGTLGDSEASTVAQGTPDSGGRIGLLAEDLSDKQKAQLRLKGGVVVRQVAPDGAAARAGLRPGDVITQIGSDVVADVADLDAVVAELPANTHIPVRLLRRGQAGFVAIRIEE